MKKTLFLLMATFLTFISSGRDQTVEDISIYSQHTSYNDIFYNSLSTGCPEPINIINTASTANSATFSWLASDPSSLILYDYYISTSNDSPNSTTTPTGTASDTTITIESLNHSNQYRFWLRANCGVEDGVSSWVGPLLFNTSQIPATLNFNEDFEGQIDWAFSNGTHVNKWVVGTATSSSSSHSLYVSNDNGLSNSYSGGFNVIHAYRDIQIPSGSNDFILSYDWKGIGESISNYMRVWLVPVTYIPTEGTSITPGNGRMRLGILRYNQQNSWKTESFIFNELSFQGQPVRLVFEWISITNSNTTAAAVDNVSFNLITCPFPKNIVAIRNQNSQEVNLTWTPVGSESQWEVIVQQSGLGSPISTDTGIIVTSPNYIFTVYGQFYEFYVRAICDGGDVGLWSEKEQFSLFSPSVCSSIDIIANDSEIIDDAIVMCLDYYPQINLSASLYQPASTTSYEVEYISYEPPLSMNEGESLNLTTDDLFTPAMNMPFDFEFFGDSFTKFKISSNGVVVFGDNDLSGEDNSLWNFNQQIPNPSFPLKNAIYGVYQDTFPTTTNGVISYQVIGTYPCRAMVINYSNLPLFMCNTNGVPQTSQIVIYETSNIVEVYVEQRTPCLQWNNGNGVIGIQNSTGTQAYSPSGRNTGAWSAYYEAYRFTPNGVITTNPSIQWLVDGEFYSDQEDIVINLSEDQLVDLQENGSYTLVLTLQEIKEDNDSESFTVVQSKEIDVIFMSLTLENEPIDLISTPILGEAVFDLTQNINVIFDGLESPWEFNFSFYNQEAYAYIGDFSLAINPFDYLGQDGEIIWVRVSHYLDCRFAVASFTLYHEIVDEECTAPTNLVASNLTFNSAELSWVSDGNSFDIEWGEQGFIPTGIPVITEVENFYLLMNLDAETYYDYYVRQDCGTELSTWTGPYTFFTGYCIPSTIQTTEYISFFATTGGTQDINYTITNQPVNSYNNVTSEIIEQKQGLSFDFTSVYFDGGHRLSIWVDWNNDIVFSEDENIHSAYSSEANQSGTITIPVETPIGFYRMRVRAQSDTSVDPDSCEELNNGSTIDFTLQVTEATSSTNNFDAESFKVYPNPVQDFLYLSHSKNIQNIEVLNLLGQTLIAKSIHTTDTKIDMTLLPTGSYLVKISVEGAVKTIRVIKQ